MSARKKAISAVLVLLCLGGTGWGAWQLGWHLWAMAEFRAARQALERRDFAQARAHLSGCLRVWPEEGETLLLAAQAARRGGALEEADSLLRQHQRLHGVSEAAAVERQLLQLQSGDMTGADSYLALCDASPETEQTALVLEALIRGGLRARDHVHAMRGVERWLRRSPTGPDHLRGLVWRGDVWLQLGASELAQSDYRAVLAVDGDNDDARLSLATSLVRFAPAEAMDHLEPLLRRRPNDQSVRFQVACCRHNLGHLEEARQLLDELLAEGLDQPALLQQRGAVALDLRQLAEAERWLRRACKLAPDDPEAARALARCLRENGKGDEAAEYEAKVKQKESEWRALYQQLFRETHQLYQETHRPQR
jgi:tetratricopeptide (TPR) repeat protein